jgi:hypothetical protein
MVLVLLLAVAEVGMHQLPDGHNLIALDAGDSHPGQVLAGGR